MNYFFKKCFNIKQYKILYYSLNINFLMFTLLINFETNEFQNKLVKKITIVFLNNIKRKMCYNDG